MKEVRPKLQKDKIICENFILQCQSEKLVKFHKMVKCVFSWPAHFKNGQSGNPAQQSYAAKRLLP